VIRAREEERARIAGELHDGLGQRITALRMVLERCQTECGDGRDGAIVRALDLVREIDREVDAVAQDLAPRVLDDLGLAAALRQLVQQWAECARVDAQFRCAVGPDRLLPEQQLVVYRVAQEALHNVQKHAAASFVHVLSEIRGRCLVLLVQDDGVGFEPWCSGSTAGCGLRGMQERAALLGGVLHLESSSGHGTTVFLRIPLLRRSAWRSALAGLTAGRGHGRLHDGQVADGLVRGNAAMASPGWRPTE
jgi:two-component system NarL family sensor kinase